jgi:hypothetical protein
MKYEQEVVVGKEKAAIINRYLTVEPKDYGECLGEDETISFSVTFDDGNIMDIDCCGVQFREGESNLAWTQAVLFTKNGAEICHSEIEEDFFGQWILEANDNQYIVNVRQYE